MVDRWKTLSIECKGGLNTSTDTLSYEPGEATQLINFEAGIYGGYRRISGYQPYDTHTVPGAGSILGVCVYNGASGQSGGVLACRGVNVYFSSGSGWGSAINSTARNGAGRYTFTKYFNVNSRMIVMCDGANPAARWDGTNYVLINGPGAPLNPKYATWWNGSLILSGYSYGGVSNGGSQSFSMSNPAIDTDFNGADGAIEIDVHDNIVGLRSFAGNLYIWCERSIWMLTGQNSSNYVLTSVATGIGCIAYDSIQEINGDIVYLSADGIRTLSGTIKQNSVELGELSKPIINIANSVFAAAGNNPDNISSTIVRKKNQYRLFYNTPSGYSTVFSPSYYGAAKYGTGTYGSFYTNNYGSAVYGLSVYGGLALPSLGQGIIGAIRPGKQMMTQFGTYISVWEWGQLQGIAPTCCDSDFIVAQEVIVHGGYDGYIYQQEIGSSFNGSNVSASYRTAPLQLEDTEIRKLLQKVTLYLNLEGTALISTTPIFDFGDVTYTMQSPSVTIPGTSYLTVYGSAYYGTATYGGGIPGTYQGMKYEARYNVQGSGKIIQFVFSSNDTNAPYSIQGISISYRPLGRR